MLSIIINRDNQYSTYVLTLKDHETHNWHFEFKLKPSLCLYWCEILFLETQLCIRNFCFFLRRVGSKGNRKTLLKTTIHPSSSSTEHFPAMPQRVHILYDTPEVQRVSFVKWRISKKIRSITFVNCKCKN